MSLTLADGLVAPPDASLDPARRMRHLIGIDDLDDPAIERILDTAGEFARTGSRDIKKLPTLRGRTVLSMFFEASTRTSTSFDLAAKRLSADVVSFKTSGSAVEKGETLGDTVSTLAAYDPDIVVLRHKDVGAPQVVAGLVDAHVVNAGDGANEHPTQTLLDLFTLREAAGTLKGLHVAIVGDIRHSRVARSNLRGLLRAGAHVALVGPPTLVPRELAQLSPRVTISHDIESIRHADAVYVLRMQFERMTAGASWVPSVREYTSGWAVTADRVRDGQLVLHPGPMNRGIEIAGDVADGPQSLVLRQVRNGLYVRMAALYDLVTMPAPSRNRDLLFGGLKNGAVHEDMAQRDDAVPTASQRATGLRHAGNRATDHRTAMTGAAITTATEATPC